MQLCAIRDDWSKFVSADTAVFGVNHGDKDSHQRFIKMHGFPFPLLIDKDKKASAKFGAITSLFGHKVIKRSIVGVDKQGKIIARFEPAIKPEGDQVIAAIEKALQ